MAREHELTRLAARQHGLASREQLLDLGFTDRQISGRVARGLWRRAAPRVYDVAPASVDPRRPLHAAVLASGGWASHRSAAHLHNLLDEPPRVPQIVVARNRTPKGLTAVVHRSAHLTYADLTIVDRITCTTALRTMLDLAGIVDQEALEHAVARGMSTRKTNVPRLLRYIDSSFAGRRGGSALRAAAAQYTRCKAETQSRLEVIVNRLIRARAIAEPVRQHRVVLPRQGLLPRLRLA